MHKIPKTMYNFTVFDAIVNGSATPDYLTSTIFEYLRNDIFNMLMSLGCLILGFPWRCYWWGCWNWSMEFAWDAKESGFYNEIWIIFIGLLYEPESGFLMLHAFIIHSSIH